MHAVSHLLPILHFFTLYASRGKHSATVSCVSLSVCLSVRYVFFVTLMRFRLINCVPTLPVYFYSLLSEVRNTYLILLYVEIPYRLTVSVLCSFLTL